MRTVRRANAGYGTGCLPGLPHGRRGSQGVHHKGPKNRELDYGSTSSIRALTHPPAVGMFCLKGHVNSTFIEQNGASFCRTLPKVPFPYGRLKVELNTDGYWSNFALQ